ncbi:MAG: ATP-binding protein [Nitrososphaerota archaeon]|jgi:DNA helicase HerA-like ATPase|nr:ATP-binding protein [Nitrososphaerota archaeon]MDG6927366.1 ATP-binding protein [Nitrososphaerota archaeon]MDG6930906.1 ATP-binding protein [Nitrososphaerota archaeon]MDG6932206.1 ATP-binding protein [Nitrososphaerota archaeon]MDG6935801.1 ATP-binding protein [Nitrososphaerota archaeon]
MIEGIFDKMGGKFVARLRDQSTRVTPVKSKEGEMVVSSPVATLEVKFDFEVLSRLHEPSFIGIERKSPSGVSYLIYEIATIKPVHFEMLGLDERLPTEIRKEYLQAVGESWGVSDETWIDLWAVPTKYNMTVKDGIPVFSRESVVPLAGSRAYLLSKQTVEKFLCEEKGVSVGSLLGFNMPLTVKPDSLVRYHTGIFGFTGSGKSNLMSYLIREAVKSDPDLSVVIFDVAGEYSINLLDMLLENGEIYSTENFRNGTASFMDSQAIPETLEERQGTGFIEGYVDLLFKEGRVKKLSLSVQKAITLGQLFETLEGSLSSKPETRLSGMRQLREFTGYFYGNRNYDESTGIQDLDGEAKRMLTAILSGIMENVSDKSNIYKQLSSIVNYMDEGTSSGEEALTSPSSLAERFKKPDSPKVTVNYVPDPDRARKAVSAFINELLYLKKTSGIRKKVLVVLDEAQEFIPDRTRSDDYSDQSNSSVESLLRQGRKYRAHCWISTQRVAHLNTNALQQLHSYFVSTLPRYYDRMVIADAFSLSTDIIEKTTELETGQWLFVSYKATKQKNVPAFIQAPNNEDILINNLKKLNK